MIGSRGGHHAPKSSKNLSSMHRTIPESSSCEKTRWRVSHSVARKSFVKGFSGEERACQRKGGVSIRWLAACSNERKRRKVIVNSLPNQRIFVIGASSRSGFD